MPRTGVWPVVIAVSFVVVSGIDGALSAPPASDEITIKDAESLVNLVVRHQIAGVKQRGVFSLDGVDPYLEPGFYAFQAHGWSPGPGSAFIGNYSVDRHTAEVWNEDSCEIIKFTSLTKLQDKILQQANIGFGHRAHTRLPVFCDFSKFPKRLR